MILGRKGHSGLISTLKFQYLLSHTPPLCITVPSSFQATTFYFELTAWNRILKRSIKCDFKCWKSMKIINLHRKAVAQVPSACITHAQFQNPEKNFVFYSRSQNIRDSVVKVRERLGGQARNGRKKAGFKWEPAYFPGVSETCCVHWVAVTVRLLLIIQFVSNVESSASNWVKSSQEFNAVCIALTSVVFWLKKTEFF